MEKRDEIELVELTEMQAYQLLIRAGYRIQVLEEGGRHLRVVYRYRDSPAVLGSIHSLESDINNLISASVITLLDLAGITSEEDVLR